MQAKRVSRRREQAATYELKVVLNGTQPPIWRRLQVPGNANLGWLHAVVQVAVGWTNSHLHQFMSGEQTYADPDAELDPSVLNEDKFVLTEVLPDIQDALIYEYDFGDSWMHVVTVEKILPGHAATDPKAVCLEGARACPPDDCGGIGGYEELLKALKNRRHPEHKNMKEWLGRPFDPEAFDLEKTNLWLRKLKWPRVTEAHLRKVLMGRDGYHE